VAECELDSSGEGRAVISTVMKLRVLYKEENIAAYERLLAFQGGLCFVKFVGKLSFLSGFYFISPSVLTSFKITVHIKILCTCFVYDSA
jgi:hypothetical protein